MTSWPQAIETKYNGFLFRSRTEARWAVFLDSLDLRYEYEKETFKLDSGCYLPDFFIPEWGCWLEVKGERPSEHEICLGEELVDATDSPMVLVHGLPNEHPPMIYCGDATDSSGGLTWWNDTTAFGHWKSGEPPRPCLASGNDRGDREFFTPSYRHWPAMALERECFRNDGVTQCAATVAKSARFEFGDTLSPATARQITMCQFRTGVDRGRERFVRTLSDKILELSREAERTGCTVSGFIDEADLESRVGEEERGQGT